MSREASELSRANALLTAEVHLLSSELERVTQTPEGRASQHQQQPKIDAGGVTPIAMAPGIEVRGADARAFGEDKENIAPLHAGPTGGPAGGASSLFKKEISMSPFLETPSPTRPACGPRCYSEVSSLGASTAGGASASPDPASAARRRDSTDEKVRALYADLKNIRRPDGPDQRDGAGACGPSGAGPAGPADSGSGDAEDSIVAKERRAREHAETIATRAISLAMKLLNESNTKGGASVSEIIDANTINKTPVMPTPASGSGRAHQPAPSPPGIGMPLLVGSPVVRSMSSVISDNLGIARRR